MSSTESLPKAERPMAAPAVALPPWRNVAVVACGGMIGAAMRYGFVVVFPNVPGRFPWTTFAENVTGAFALGCLLMVLLERWRSWWAWHPLLCTGVLGSFTTFSVLSLEVLELGRNGRPGLAVGYALASVAAGLVAAGAGMMLGRSWARRGGKERP